MWKKIKHHSPKLLLISILCIAFFLRLYKAGSWLTFGMDQEYEYLIVRNIVSLKHFPAIGVNASDTGLYLGPFFLYFSAIPYILFSGNPIGGTITASLISVFVCWLIFKIGKSMYSFQAGIFGSLIYGGSMLVTFYDRQFWNPTPVPLFSLLIGFFIYQIFRHKDKYLIYLAIIFGIALQCHLSLLIFLPLLIFALWIRRKSIPKRTVLLSLIFFILLQFPVIFFEFKHNFTNSRSLIQLISHSGTNTVSPTTVLERNSLFISTLGRFFSLPLASDLFLESGQCQEMSSYRADGYPPATVAVVFSLVIVLYLFFKDRKREFGNNGFNDEWSLKTTAGLILSTLFFVEFYPREIFEYYFLFFFPWLALILGWSLSMIWKIRSGKKAVLSILSIFIIMNFLSLLSASYSFSFDDKMKSIQFAKRYIDNRNYSLESVGECPRYGGYRYLFGHFIHQPVHSYMDSYFSWLYQDTLTGNKPEYIVLLSLIDPRDSENMISKWEQEKMQFLENYSIVAENNFGMIKEYILVPK